MTTISKQPRGSGTASQIEKCREKMAETTERLRTEIEGPASAAAERLRDAVDTGKRPLLNLWADKPSSAREFVVLGSAGAPGIDSTDLAQSKSAKKTAHREERGSTEGEAAGSKKAPARGESVKTRQKRLDSRAWAVEVTEKADAQFFEKERRDRFRKGVLIAGGAAAAVASIGGAVAAISNNGPSQPTDPSITQNTNQTSNDDVKNAVDDYANTGKANVDSAQVSEARLEAFKQVVEDAEDGGSVSSDEFDAIKSAFSRLSPSTHRAALDFLLEHGNDDVFNSCASLSEAQVSFEAFERAVDNFSDGGSFSSDEMYALRIAFSKLDAAGQSDALEYLLAEGEEDLYVSVMGEASSEVRIGFDAFKEGTESFSDSGSYDSAEFSALRDAFSRLDAGGQQMALEYLLETGEDGLYQACSSLGESSIGIDAFKSAVDQFRDGGSYSSDEIATIRNAFTRLDLSGQGQALDHLLEEGEDDVYLACMGASSDAKVSLSSFEQGVEQFGDGGSYSSDEISALRDAFVRLDSSSQSAALSSLLADGNDDLYQQCAAYASSEVSVNEDAFEQGVDAFQDGGSMSSDELAAARDAFARLSEMDQESALNHLLSEGYDELFNICMELAD